MSEVFISYAREDRPRVEELAQALEADGLDIWWDRSIPAGETFDDVIQEALTAARCVVVVWSRHSVGSRWVRTEAGEGADRGILVPVRIDDAQVPLAFRRIQAVDLAGDGSLPPEGDAELVAAVRRVLGRPAPPVTRRRRRRPARRSILLWSALFLALLALIWTLFYFSGQIRDGGGVTGPAPKKTSDRLWAPGWMACPNSGGSSYAENIVTPQETLPDCDSGPDSVVRPAGVADFRIA